MKANELRIGNLILIKYPHNKDFIVTVITSGDDINACLRSPIYFNPIPLTEEWLGKLGFEPHFDKIEEINYFCYKDFVIENEFFCFGYADAIVYDLLRVNKKNPLKYVHQLQNLYFSLTGDELTVKKYEINF